MPAGKRIILKFLLFTNQTGATKSVSARIDGVGTLYANNVTAAGTTGASISFNVWTVIDDGQTLAVNQSSANAVLFVASGYLLYV